MNKNNYDHTPGKLTLGQCAMDVFTALTALYLTMTIPLMETKAAAGFPADKVLHFLVIVAFPSIMFGIILAYAAKRRGIAVHLAKTALSIAVSYLLYMAMRETHLPVHLRKVEIIFGLGLFAVLSLACEAASLTKLWASGGPAKVLLVGNGDLARQMEEAIVTHHGGFEMVGKVDYPAPGMVAKAEDTQDIFDTAKKLGANKVVVSLTERRGVFPLQEMLNCKLSGIEVLDSPALFERMTGKLLIENITPSWFIFCHGFQVTPLLRAAKRTMDICLSLFGLAMFAPFWLLVTLAIKLDSPGPVFFRQIRVGEGDKPFTLIKFRSMRQDAEKLSGAVWASKNDSRVTRLGKFLRKSRIDEIPQLINVLKGEMSLVGPRPERPEFVKTLKERIPYYSERHFVKPGVSGWAQVRYPYGASVEDAVEKLRYDLFYIKNISIMLDLKIIFKTITVMLFCRGGR